MAVFKQVDNILGILRQLVKGAGQGLFGNAVFFDTVFPNTAKENDVLYNSDDGQTYAI